MKREKRKNPIARMRIPLPRQTGGPQGTPKGKRGYDRKQAKKELRKAAYENRGGIFFIGRPEIWSFEANKSQL